MKKKVENKEKKHPHILTSIESKKDSKTFVKEHVTKLKHSTVSPKGIIDE